MFTPKDTFFAWWRRRPSFVARQIIICCCAIMSGEFCRAANCHTTSFSRQRCNANSFSSTMAAITTIACLYLLWKRERRRNGRRLWVHHINQSRTELGEFHRLLQELRLDDDRFQRLSFFISRLDTNYRRSISASERLSICLR